MNRQDIEKEIVSLVQFYSIAEESQKKWIPGESKVPYAGRVTGAEERINLVGAMLDGWLTLGRYGDELEKELEKFLGARDVLLVNSGSSANLVAVTSLFSSSATSRLVKGDCVITPAATFPTTLAPLLQNELTPIFVDCEIGTYNANIDQVEEAANKHDPKNGYNVGAIMLPHTLGNVFDLERVVDICKKRNLLLIEDSCDALGSTWDGQHVGTFGDFGTLSFYPAHHMTMGEGGAVITNNSRLAKISESVRDWGRSCWCATGVSDTCGKRFGWKMGDLPQGYDHKYIYDRVGYNLKPTDLQAAVGLAQVKKLPSFIEKRKANFKRLYNGLKDLEEYFVLPKWHPRADVSWFAFPLTVKDGAGFERRELIQYLEASKIETRMVFAGNILRQPAFKYLNRFKLADSLPNTDKVMTHTFFVGVYPGLTDVMIDYMIEKFHFFIKSR